MVGGIGRITAAGRLSLIMLAFLVPLGLATTAEASGLIPPAQHNRLVTQLDKRPMVFFVARGGPDSCGPGCHEWIGAEGTFVPGTTQRFRDLLATLGRRDLPVYFHSLGGIMSDALEVGRILRERGMTAGVGRSITEQCRVFAREDPCQRLIASGGAIQARLRTREGQCHSACVLAFVGASSRRIPEGSILGVHSPRFDEKLRQQVIQRSPQLGEITLSVLQQAVEQYLTLMGIDPRLQQVASRVDSRRMYSLSRAEIRRFGIETLEYVEPPFTDAPKYPVALKLVTPDAARREHRRVHLRCLRGQIWLVYRHEFPPNEIGYAASVRVMAGGNEVVLQRGPRRPASEVWAVPAGAYFLRGVAAARSMVFTEEVAPDDSSAVRSRDQDPGRRIVERHRRLPEEL